MSKILIFGHKKPDTDSVVAAISLSYLKNKLGFDTDCKVYGFFDGYLNKDFKPVILDAGMIFKPSVSVSATHYVWLKPPIYFEGSIKGELESLINLYINDAAKGFVPTGSIEMEIGARGLRSVMESIMTDVMYDVPSDDRIERVVITKGCVDNSEKPKTYTRPKPQIDPDAESVS